MTCKLCEEKLLEYLYDELDEAARTVMDRHLAESPACRETLEGFRQVRAQAAGQVREEPPAGFATRVLAHAAEQQKRRRRGWARMLRPVLTTAVVAVIATIVYVRTSQIHNPTEAVRTRISREARQDAAPRQGGDFAPGATPGKAERKVARDEAETAEPSLETDRHGDQTGRVREGLLDGRIIRQAGPGRHASERPGPPPPSAAFPAGVGRGHAVPDAGEPPEPAAEAPESSGETALSAVEFGSRTPEPGKKSAAKIAAGVTLAAKGGAADRQRTSPDSKDSWESEVAGTGHPPETSLQGSDPLPKLEAEAAGGGDSPTVPAAPLPAEPAPQAKSGPPRHRLPESAPAPANVVPPPSSPLAEPAPQAKSGPPRHRLPESAPVPAVDLPPAADAAPTSAPSSAAAPPGQAALAPSRQGSPAPLPAPVSQVLELVETGRCREALGLLEVFASHNPGEKTSGSAWLELARCFLGKGDRERAGKMALKASAFPDSAREAEAILADLDAPDI